MNYGESGRHRDNGPARPARSLAESYSHSSAVVKTSLIDKLVVLPSGVTFFLGFLSGINTWS